MWLIEQFEVILLIHCYYYYGEKEIIAKYKQYYTRVHTFNARWSYATKGFHLEWQCEKRHQDSEIWIPLKAHKLFPIQ